MSEETKQLARRWNVFQGVILTEMKPYSWGGERWFVCRLHAVNAQGHRFATVDGGPWRSPNAAVAGAHVELAKVVREMASEDDIYLPEIPFEDLEPLPTEGVNDRG
jgi:hypothetical protein